MPVHALGWVFNELMWKPAEYLGVVGVRQALSQQENVQRAWHEQVEKNSRAWQEQVEKNGTSRWRRRFVASSSDPAPRNPSVAVGDTHTGAGGEAEQQQLEQGPPQSATVSTSATTSRSRAHQILHSQCAQDYALATAECHWIRLSSVILLLNSAKSFVYLDEGVTSGGAGCASFLPLALAGSALGGATAPATGAAMARGGGA